MKSHAAQSSNPVRAPAGADGRQRAIIENVQPTVDGGRFAIKRVLGESVIVEADAFTDGHDAVRARVRYRGPVLSAVEGSVLSSVEGAQREWRELEMEALGNDRWRAQFHVDSLGLWEFDVCAWVDHTLTWRRELLRREDPADVLLALQVGATLLDEAAARAGSGDARQLAAYAAELRAIQDPARGKQLALAPELDALVAQYPQRRFQAAAGPFAVRVDPIRARFSSWYEFFPRSTAREPGEHGTFAACEARIDYAAELGFDVVYLPPIHPIGRIKRKGPNNTLTPEPGDPGSPWAIGAQEGGHKEIHAPLGTPEDFKRLLAHAHSRGIELAIDIAFQCAPDHPYVQSHPEWFRKRPDGTIQYAENPPKQYQDIYPFDFENEAWQALYAELIDVVMHWVRQGVRIFRVDNPHTKPFPLWERLIAEVKAQAPDAIFLSEAFTRPKVMHRLAKLGFTQSYTYFPWRNTKHELTAYFTELCLGPGREYFRPNTWPNTPDILTEYLQIGGRAAFMTRFVLAATLSAAYGIYGPAFELMEHEPRAPGSEEYRDSEKYQIRHWDLQRPDSLAPFIARVNRIRREHAALQSDWSLQFIDIDNEQMLAFMKSVAVPSAHPHPNPPPRGGGGGQSMHPSYPPQQSGRGNQSVHVSSPTQQSGGGSQSVHPSHPTQQSGEGSRSVHPSHPTQQGGEGSRSVHPSYPPPQSGGGQGGGSSSEQEQDHIIVVVNLDPWHAQSGWLELPLGTLDLTVDRPYRVQDLLGGGSFLWQGARNFVRLDPNGAVAHIFHLRRRVRTEHDFDYFL
ncbi:MAG TPA: alpha-1,4-glucan--maltose-1-phosphate maltosyltransferase [Steroidobacteraceae bacterium]|nr:alpha-1,4-glucan--maltose-1-phosphate maltosyltransferase [Steroidobacteraceae bacterium]